MTGVRAAEAAERAELMSYLWQTLSFAIQELPQGLPLVQCGLLVAVVVLPLAVDDLWLVCARVGTLSIARAAAIRTNFFIGHPR
jgi:hypothetical protein